MYVRAWLDILGIMMRRSVESRVSESRPTAREGRSSRIKAPRLPTHRPYPQLVVGTSFKSECEILGRLNSISTAIYRMLDVPSGLDCVRLYFGSPVLSESTARWSPSV